jgi:signal transduction histidine kinase
MAKPNRSPEQLEGMAADVRGAVDRAEHLVESLLTLARSQHLAHASEPIDLAVAAQDALDNLDREIAARGLTVYAALSPAPAVGDRTLLDRLVSNVIDNAVRHNHPGGWLSVHTVHDGHHTVIMVTNTGAEIDPAEVTAAAHPGGGLSITVRFPMLSAARPTALIPAS